ncbi:MAG: DUF559 domain-containing protein [Solirubrobacteraceae bacterium]
MKRGTLHGLHRGVYAVGHRKLTREGHLLAASLSAGSGAFISHRTAAGLHGLRALNMRQIDVSVVAGQRRRRSGLNLHAIASQPADTELTSRNGLTLSTVPRLLVELCDRETETELERLITAAVRRQILNHGALEQALQRHGGRPGIAKLGRAYAAYRPRPRRNSELERAFDRLLEVHPEIPEPLRNVWLGEWELDCYWPAQRLVLELDGRPYHSAVKDMERDRLRDAQLLARGIATLRITDRRYNDDPDGALADLLAALELRAA